MKKNKVFKYAIEYVKCLNKFCDEYEKVIDKSILDDEYCLMTDIVDILIYEHRGLWRVNFKKKQYREHIIYKTDKTYWKKLFKLYKKMWIFTFIF